MDEQERCKIMALSAVEQYLLELINRARLDPAAEAARYGLDLNANLDAGTISTAAKQVLAPNTTLAAAAQTHSEWMLARDVFSHTGEGGSDPGDRMEDAGYDFTGRWSWRENLAWYGRTGSIDLVDAIERHHEGLYRSEGHRVNTFGAEVREAGIAQVEGQFTSNSVTYNASMLTLNYAATGSDMFVTGVVFQDTDADAFYDIGEGQSGWWLRGDGAQVNTATAGGYGLGVTPDADLRVTLGTGAQLRATLDIDARDQNAKLDVIIANNGDLSLAVSSDTKLVSGIADAVLLGVADLNLTGSAADNVLTGNTASNILRGEAGNDQLLGGAGADQLFGGAGNDLILGGEGRDGLVTPKTGSITADMLSGDAGNDVLMGLSGFDVLDGGTGNDTLTGGGGRDTFIFQDGRDTITDFADNVDQITLNGAALGDADLTVNEVIAMGRVVDGDAIFDFGNGDVLTLHGLTDLQALGNDLMIV